jgi:hypothetical protein
MIGLVRARSLGGTTRYRLTGFSAFIRCAIRKSDAEVLRAITGSR